MRILQVSAGREWRGGQQQVRLLARELARREGVEQRLATDPAAELARRAAADGVRIEPLSWALAVDPRALWQLTRLIRRFRPHILHAHDSHALNLSLAARWLASNPRPALIATRRVIFRIRPGSSWHRADHLIAVSHAVRDVLVACGVPIGRVSVAHSAVDPDEVRAAARRPFNVRGRLGLAPGTRLAVNPAALERPKDQRTLIRAAAAARTAAPGLHWVIAGEGRERGRLEAEARALGVADIVHFLGYVEEIEPLIGEGDVLVMSSREEGLGGAVMQARVLGKPVAATRAGGLVEITPEHGLVPVGDADALARKVVEALSHPSPVPLPPQFAARAMADAVLDVYGALV